MKNSLIIALLGLFIGFAAPSFATSNVSIADKCTTTCCVTNNKEKCKCDNCAEACVDGKCGKCEHCKDAKCAAVKSGDDKKDCCKRGSKKKAKSCCQKQAE